MLMVARRSAEEDSCAGLQGWQAYLFGPSSALGFEWRSAFSVAIKPFFYL